jgi:hypothetical protein
MRILLALLTLATATPSVTKLILRPAQVGPGYALVERGDSVGVVNTVTLDLCGRSGYPSEQLRTARLQLYYLRRGSAMGLSNEVVAYRPGGARQAMQEVRRHAFNCPRTPIETGQSGLPRLTVAITPIKDPQLLKGYLAVRVRVTGKVKGKSVDEVSFAVYQRFGNVLSGTYSFGGPTTPVAQQARFALQAAEQSAVNLRFGGPPIGPVA